MELTYTQCKQIAANHPDGWQRIIGKLKNQPPWAHRQDSRHMGNGEPLSLSDILAIQGDGCISGELPTAYAPRSASEIMAEHGNAVEAYVFQQLGDLLDWDDWATRAQLASRHLSTAIELWCRQFNLEGVDCD